MPVGVTSDLRPPRSCQPFPVHVWNEVVYLTKVAATLHLQILMLSQSGGQHEGSTTCFSTFLSFSAKSSKPLQNLHVRVVI